MSKKTPHAGGLPGRAFVKLSLASPLVTLFEHNFLQVSLSCHGKYFSTQQRYKEVSSKFCKTMSSLLLHLTPNMYFCVAPHHRGPNLFSFAIFCRASKRFSGWNQVKTWLKPVTTRRALRESKKGWVVLACISENGDRNQSFQLVQEIHLDVSYFGMSESDPDFLKGAAITVGRAFILLINFLLTQGSTATLNKHMQK